MRARLPLVLGAVLAAATMVAGVPDPATASPAALSWTVQDVPLPAHGRATSSSVARVSCASNQLCTVIVSGAHVSGARQNVAMMLHDGAVGTPTVLPVADPGSFALAIGGVSCASVRLCFAAGSAGDSDGLLETYDGTSWTASVAPGGPFPGEVGFNDVDCGATNCLATGFYTEYTGEPFAFGVTRNNATGGLRPLIVQSPSPAAKERNRYQAIRDLYAPACAPTGPCMALAYSGWFAYPSGTGLTAVRMPVPDGINQADLYLGGAMSCAARTDCATLGTYVDATGTRQYLLAEALTDGVLAAVPIPIPATLRALRDPLQPRAIDCPSMHRCVGVFGFRKSTAQHGAWLVRWDGTRWRASMAPLPADAIGADAGDLTGVSCASTRVCQAVGTYRTATGLRPLIETVVGATVTPSSPSAPAGDVTLQDISCAQSTCLASGFRTVGGSTTPVVAVARPAGSA